MAIALPNLVNGSEFIEALVDQPYHHHPEVLPLAVLGPASTSLSWCKVSSRLVISKTMEILMPQFQ